MSGSTPVGKSWSTTGLTSNPSFFKHTIVPTKKRKKNSLFQSYAGNEIHRSVTLGFVKVIIFVLDFYSHAQR